MARRDLAVRCPVDQGAVVIHQPWQQTQMGDRAVTGWYQVDDLARRCRVFVTGHDQGAWRDLGLLRASFRNVHIYPVRSSSLKQP